MAGVGAHVLARPVFFHVHVRGFKLEPAAVGHGVAGIHSQVHDHLLELAGVCLYVAQARLQIYLQMDVFAQQPHQQVLHVVHNRVQVQDARSEHLLPAKGEQLARERGSAVGGFKALVQLVFVRIVLAQVLKHKLGVTLDNGQQIIKVMRNTTSEATHGFHLLRLAKLLLEGAMLSDIFNDALRVQGPALRVVDDAATQTHGDGIAVAPLHLYFQPFPAATIGKISEQTLASARVLKDIAVKVQSKQLGFRLVAQHGGERGIYGQELAINAGLEDAINGTLHQRTIARFGKAQLLLIAPVLDCGGHVPGDKCKNVFFRFAVTNIVSIGLDHQNADGFVVNHQRHAQPIQRRSANGFNLSDAHHLFEDCRCRQQWPSGAEHVFGQSLA